MSFTDVKYQDGLKLCRDCKYFYYESTDWGSMELCRHPIETKIDLVSGIKKYSQAENVRRSSERCGIKGELFTAKPSKAKKKWWIF